MTDRGKTLLIGLCVLIAIVVIIWGLFVINPRLGDGEQVLRVRFPSVEKISVGTRVLFAGKPVGQVVAINEVYDARRQPREGMGPIYFYEVVLAIDSTIEVYDSDEIVVHTSGFMGDKNIAIIPKAVVGELKARRLMGDEILYAQSREPMQQAFDQVASLGEKMENTMDKVIGLIDSNKSELHMTIKSIRQAIDQIDVAITYANEINLIGTAKDSLINISRAMDQLAGRLADLEQEELIAKLNVAVGHLAAITAAIDQPEQLSALVTNIRRFSDALPDLGVGMQAAVTDVRTAAVHVDQVVTNISEGQGTIGKLVDSSDLYFRFLELLEQTNTLMGDVNQYGFLFHLDKQWQRTRLKR
ncbi:MCE family protein [Simkania negevensis]|uniref:MCE family protein n=1 Tax=Simkania negevensis TaxID=83561 RepID=A0ABS3APE4_9BACT|nr:MCE family protein [Simkania negevensis]